MWSGRKKKVTASGDVGGDVGGDAKEAASSYAETAGGDCRRRAPSLHAPLRTFFLRVAKAV